MQQQKKHSRNWSDVDTSTLKSMVNQGKSNEEIFNHFTTKENEGFAGSTVEKRLKEAQDSLSGEGLSEEMADESNKNEFIISFLKLLW